MPHYKSFREQLIECKDKNIAYYENCHFCGHTFIMCKKYGGFCISGKCRDDRIQRSEEEIYGPQNV